MTEMEEMKARLDELRQLYLRATPVQRYKVALDRIMFSNSEANKLVQYVGAVEGFARSIAIELKCRNGIKAENAYSSLRYLNAVIILEDHICPAKGKTAGELFGVEDWNLFTLAVEFRNFLVHEASSVRASYSGILSSACHRILDKLAKIGNVLA